MTNEEKLAVVVRALNLLLGCKPRAADVLLCEDMVKICDTLEGVAGVVAAYVWDHILGEPRRPTVEQLARRIINAERRHPRTHGYVVLAYPQDGRCTVCGLRRDDAIHE